MVELQKSVDVICIGRLMVDLLFRGLSDIPEIGKETEVDSYTVDLGGSSAITAAACSRLGLKAALVSATGDDLPGEFAQRELVRHGVDVTCLATRANPTSLCVELTFESDRATVIGAGTFDDAVLDLDVVRQYVANSRHLHVVGLTESRIQLLRLASESGATTSLDANLASKEQASLFGEASPLIDFVFPNRSEVPSSGDLETVVKQLGNSVRGYGVATLGSEGAIASDGRELIRKRGFVVDEVIDTTGAGDAFNAGFVFATLKHLPVEESIVLGNAMGALNVVACGGAHSVPSLERLRSFLASNGERLSF